VNKMNETEYCMKPIGVIHTPFKKKSETPIQFSRSTAHGEIELFSEYEQGLEDIEELSHLILIYIFHEALNSKDLLVKQFLDDKNHGVFATRFYRRPNPIGFSVVRLIQKTGLHLQIQWVDMLDGTPLLDIKRMCPSLMFIQWTNWVGMPRKHINKTS
jgi:tRNA (adenine37-N6)-methyltransferase